MSSQVAQLAEDGQGRASVVLSHTAGRVERFAAAELVRYVAQMSGAELPIDTQPTSGLLPIDLRVVPGPPAPPTNDGYSLRVTPDGIAITGDNERGALYGVYDLLERLGCRWYYPTIDPDDPEIIPTLDTVSLPPLDVTEVGGFEWRVAHMGSVLQSLKLPDALHQLDWAAKARFNIVAFLLVDAADAMPAQALAELGTAHLAPPPNTTLESFIDGVREYETSGVVDALRDRGMLLEGPLHCMVNLFPNSLFDQHPDWFGMNDAGGRVPQHALGPEFCWSNADAVAAFAANVVTFIRACPFLDVFAFTPNDGGRPCACPACQAHRPSDLYAGVANAVQSALRAAGLHQPVEITGGYPPVADPPAPGVLDPDIRVHWAHWGRPHFEWYGKPDYGMRENLDGWLSLPNPFTMVEYYPDGFAGPSIHPPMATALGRDNRWLIDHGVRGNFQLMHSHQQWWNHTLAAWLGIAFYYSERDPLEFLDDYATHYFGPAAAEAMVAYHRIFEVEPWLAYWAQGERWSDPGWANPDETARGVDLLDRLEALLDEAEKATTDPLDSYRLSKLLTVGRAQILLGRARARSTALIHEVDKSRQADGLRAALAFEREVVEPLAAALRDDPRALGSDDMYHKLTKTAPLIEQALAELS